MHIAGVPSFGLLSRKAWSKPVKVLIYLIQRHLLEEAVEQQRRTAGCKCFGLVFSLDFSSVVVARKHCFAYCVLPGKRVRKSRLFSCISREFPVSVC